MCRIPQKVFILHLIFAAYFGCNINIFFFFFFPAPLPNPGKLQEVEVPIVSNTECRKVYGSLVTDTNMCAGPAGGGKGTCSVSVLATSYSHG